MNVPKRLYPHLYEYNKLMKEGKDLTAQWYASKHERDLEFESTEMFQVVRNRRFAFGTDKKIHGIDEK